MSRCSQDLACVGTYCLSFLSPDTLWSSRCSFTHTAVNSPLTLPGRPCRFCAGGITTAAAATPAAGTEPQGGKNVFPLSDFWSILKTAHTPHMSLQVIGFLQFHNHHTLTKKKKKVKENMTSFSGQKVIILLLSAGHVILFPLIFSATLQVSYFTD